MLLAQNIVFARNASFCILRVNFIYPLVNFVQINGVEFYFHAVLSFFAWFVSGIVLKYTLIVSQVQTPRFLGNARQRIALSTQEAATYNMHLSAR